MKITLTSIPVADQEQALTFYTETLGFIKKVDVPMGEHRWLTVAASEAPDGVELLLEPLGFPPAREYYRQLFEAGIPVAQFESDDLDSEVANLRRSGVVFRDEPKEMDGVKFVIFEDSCGNLICLTQKV